MTKCTCTQQEKINNQTVDIAKMTVKIENIELTVRKTDKTINKVDKKLDDFINSANKTYATKEELKTIKLDLEKANDNQDKKINWNKEKIIDVLIKLATIGAISSFFIWG